MNLKTKIKLFINPPVDRDALLGYNKKPTSKFKMKPSFHQPEVIEKTWGKEIVIHNSNLYCGKILEFKKHHHSSLHYHTEKTETWFVLSGLLLLEYRENDQIAFRALEPNTVVHLPAQTLHKLTAVSDSTIIEVSTTHLDTDTTRILPSGKYA